MQVLANTKSIELDLGKTVPSGRYSLKAKWDWDAFEVGGFLNVSPLTDFASARLTPATHDRLAAGKGKVPLTVEHGDFEFVNKVELKKINDEFAMAIAVPFVLPKGLREGAQDRMDIELATNDLEPGDYNLIVSHVDGKAHDVRLQVLPDLPSIENLPVRLNQGLSSIDFTLRGKRLDLIQRLEIPRANTALGPASADGTERNVSIKMASPVDSGSVLSAKIFVADRLQPMSVDGALSVLEPRPAITDLTLSRPPDQSVQLGNGELPGGPALSAMLHVEHFPAGGAVKLQCEQPGSSDAVTLRPGQEAGGSHLDMVTSDQLFLTFGTSAWFSGCVVEATVTGANGDSAPRRVARIVDVPTVEQFSIADDGSGHYQATLVGMHLETIGKAGWTPDDENVVAQLPQPLPGDSHRQRLQFTLTPPPGSDAILYVALRGESKGRVTTLHAN